ncbi:hypothetical protein IEQ34_020035 [Dendrobium chrysotoxum]|uniref:Glycosyltransferase 61 catalytic domain-containing protein n=1 Tax=Dendrobium chrysotoxum TaxID=161865 RepID=A0AAV7G935_DENCH|nr:hypothetical protein IEQ34_020035 [Dendrobium chrysotoxum]
MAKGSRRLVLGFLFLPLLYALLLRLNLSSFHAWKKQLSHWSSISFESSYTDFQQSTAFMKLQLQTLVRESGRHELKQNGVTCISDHHSDICITENSVRITATSTGITVHMTAGQTLPPSAPSRFILHPYPRKNDPDAISRTTPVTLLPTPSTPPPCSSHYSSPALLFSAGGFAGNFFHDINDVIIPLFLTSSPLRPDLHLVITDLQSYWSLKYHRILRLLSAFDPIIIQSPSRSPAKVLCFPAAIIGLKYHGTLLCNSTEPPGAVSTSDFRRFLHDSLISVPHLPGLAKPDQPVLVLISRNKSRMLMNEEGVVRVARKAGFNVVVAKPEMMKRVEQFAGFVNRCKVLMGVHGAGLTNMVFLPPEGVVLQIVPWGLEWAAKEYFERPARRLGLRYVEYHIQVEESSLYEKYPKHHPVISDPWSVNRKGYNVSRPVFTDGQNLRIDLVRFRKTVLQARSLILPDTS